MGAETGVVVAAGSLVDMLTAIAETLEDGGLGEDVTIAPLGMPNCMVAVLVRPTGGEAVVTNNCECEVGAVLGIYASLGLCGIENAHQRVYDLTSGCGVDGAILKVLKEQKNALQAKGWFVKAGQPTGYTLTRYNAEGDNNAYYARIPLTIRYKCC